MSLRGLDAASAYAQTLTRAPGFSDDGMDKIGSSAPAGGPGGFGDMVSGLLKDTVAANHQAEVASARSVTGKGDIVSIASAVNNAEMTLETLVAVRDRMISAYQDIMRMPI